MRNNRYRSAPIPAVVVLALALVLCAGAGQARAQSGGGFSLTWNTAPGGGGASTGGQFTLQGTAGQKQAVSMQGGVFSVVPGYQQPECTAGAAEDVTVVATLDGSDVTLTWVHQAANGAYEIYRGSQPGFIPGPATLLATVFAPQATYTDEGAAGDPAAHRYYVVRPKCGGLWGEANRTGAFSFEIVH